jgi:hypothetical protein
MKLETSVELLERVRAVQGVSWWKLPGVLEASESTVKNWKRGRTTIDRKFATRIADILHEPPEYILACIEGEREASPELRKLWRRIAERFRSTAAIILLAGLGLLTVHGKASAAMLDVELVGNVKPTFYVLCATRPAGAGASVSELPGSPRWGSAPFQVPALNIFITARAAKAYIHPGLRSFLFLVMTHSNHHGGASDGDSDQSISYTGSHEVPPHLGPQLPLGQVF